MRHLIWLLLLPCDCEAPKAVSVADQFDVRKSLLSLLLNWVKYKFGESDLSIQRSLPSVYLNQKYKSLSKAGIFIRLPLAMLSGILVQQVVNSQALSPGERKTG